MIKRTDESHVLPPLRRDILLYLATEGPQTKNSIALGVSRSYKPTWTALNTLESKKLIKATRVKTHRRRDYPQFWLTHIGVLTALAEGANPDGLLLLTRQIYPENQSLAFCLELFSKMSLHTIEIFCSVLLVKGRLESTDVINALLTETPKISDQQLREIIDTLKAYPQQYDLFKKEMKEILDQINQML